MSPVLLFSKEEYEEHGKYTILDHYTFNWPDGRMALSLGLGELVTIYLRSGCLLNLKPLPRGSLFNHSESPNVSFSIESSTQTIRYTSTRTVQEDEELCIFYGHNHWFTPLGSSSNGTQIDGGDVDDAWGGLLALSEVSNPFSEGNPREIMAESDLPFWRTKVTPDDENEDVEGSVRTSGCCSTLSIAPYTHKTKTFYLAPAWVIDVPDPKLTSTLLK